MRHEKYALLQCILEGKIDGKRARGRWKTSWMSNIRNWLGKNRAELIHTARDICHVYRQPQYLRRHLERERERERERQSGSRERNEWCVKLSTHFHLVPRLGMRGVLSPFPTYTICFVVLTFAITAWLKCYFRVLFTLAQTCLVASKLSGQGHVSCSQALRSFTIQLHSKQFQRRCTCGSVRTVVRNFPGSHYTRHPST
jgi:hypothetical protein